MEKGEWIQIDSKKGGEDLSPFYGCIGITVNVLPTSMEIQMKYFAWFVVGVIVGVAAVFGYKKYRMSRAQKALLIGAEEVVEKKAIKVNVD